MRRGSVFVGACCLLLLPSYSLGNSVNNESPLTNVNNNLLFGNIANIDSPLTRVNAHLLDGMHASDIITAASVSPSSAITEITEVAKSSATAAVAEVSEAAKSSTATATSQVAEAAIISTGAITTSASAAINAANIAAAAAVDAVNAAMAAADAARTAAAAASDAANAASQSAVATPDGIPPAWYQTLPADKRFALVLNDEAVLDKETGLVWERSPSQKSQYYPSWQGTSVNPYAIEYCTNLMVGGRMGWNIPTAQQLASLVDTSTYFSGEPALPAGHPFDTDCSSGGCVAPAGYFTSTVLYGRPSSRVVAIDFSQGVALVPESIAGNNTPLNNRMWCVRSGR